MFTSFPLDNFPLHCVVPHGTLAPGQVTKFQEEVILAHKPKSQNIFRLRITFTCICIHICVCACTLSMGSLQRSTALYIYVYMYIYENIHIYTYIYAYIETRDHAW